MVFMFWFILLQQLAPFDPSKKKKKKKVVIQEPVEDVAESSQTEKSDSLPGMMKSQCDVKHFVFCFQWFLCYLV